MNINDALAKEYNRGLADGKASVKQKHGHWERDFDGDVACSVCNHYLYSKTIREASHCKSIPIVQELKPLCPYCGAKMDEVTE